MQKEIKEYIKKFPNDIQKILKEMYNIIREVVPEEASEKISWQMPTFYLNGNLVHFAAQKHHVGFYPGVSGIENFTKQFDKNGLKYSKGGVQFKYINPLPKELIQKIVKFRVKENM